MMILLLILFYFFFNPIMKQKEWIHNRKLLVFLSLAGCFMDVYLFYKLGFVGLPAIIAMDILLIHTYTDVQRKIVFRWINYVFLLIEGVAFLVFSPWASYDFLFICLLSSAFLCCSLFHMIGLGDSLVFIGCFLCGAYYFSSVALFYLSFFFMALCSFVFLLLAIPHLKKKKHGFGLTDARAFLPAITYSFFLSLLILIK